MSQQRWFRLSSYLTLGLSCGLLVSAEAFFLPNLHVCLAPMLALLLLAWWVEGRWSLPVWGVNLLAALIAVGGITWLAMHFSDDDSWLMRVPLHLALMPYTGPLLMAALLVKVFQQRQPSDFWRLQGLGLMQVGLGCVLAADLEFGGWLAAYLASAPAALALRYRQSVAATADNRLPGAAWWLLPFMLRWTLLVAGLGLLLFLLTPRRNGAAWVPLNSSPTGSYWPTRTRVGQSAEINLNSVGLLELDDEEALQVTATDSAGQPKLDLPADQRWRGAALDWYEAGRWVTTHPLPAPPRVRFGQRQLPEFGPGQYFLNFTLQPRRAGGFVLAEPIRLGSPPARLPVISLPGTGRPARFFEVSGTVLPLLTSLNQEYHYRQVVPAQADTSRSPADGFQLGEYRERLTRQRVAGLQEWTIDLLRRLSAQPRYRLPDGVRAALAESQQTFLIIPDDWEPVARALTDYLANSGEFTYTLERTRQDLTVDPVMDFLVNLKQGHCARYATALALMLRSIGIPARLVKGFRGAEHQGDGVYVVRHHHAHAWVEMLTPRHDSPDPSFDWLTLDPTPSESASSRIAFSLAHWWQGTQQSLAQWWQTLILDYNADEQANLWDRLQEDHHRSTLLKLGLLLLSVPVALIGFALLRRWNHRRRAAGPRPSNTVAFYGRLLTLLARHAALRPRHGQTPHEFGEAARQFLQTRPVLSSLSDVPIRVVELFYRVRFGGRPLSEPESRTLDAEMDRLTEALRSCT
ncbi:MAG TPA: transglutaminase domain-containing protein [Gemmataceae bacterium]|nr:transglutaminase domain-containing protein [Gemmataceae bacterium]